MSNNINMTNECYMYLISALNKLYPIWIYQKLDTYKGILIISKIITIIIILIVLNTTRHENIISK